MNKYQLEDRLLVYIDFLGTSAAVKTWSDDRLSRFLELLHEVASQSGPYKYEGTSVQFSISPEVSTFSDHVVMSYPMRNEVTTSTEWPPEVANAVLLQSLRVRVAMIAVEALDVGLLIRGGLAYGKAYHSSGVVLGKALVEAHDLESRVANYPRVILSEDVCALPVTTHKLDQLADADGIRHLNYFRDMVSFGALRRGGNWIAEIREMIERQVTEFRRNRAMSEFTKWSWFKTAFNEAVPKTEPSLARLHLSPGPKS